MKNNPDMLEEYDFSGAVLGKYAKQYEDGKKETVRNI